LRKTTREYHFSMADYLEDIDYLEATITDFWENYYLKDIRPDLILPKI